MKVLHAPFCYYPDPVGGTEVYVEALGRCLHRKGIGGVVAVSAPQNQSYVHEGQRVRRFKVSESIEDLKELYGLGDEESARSFCALIDEEQPNIVHFHAFCKGLALKTLQAVKAKGIPTVFTYHTPDLTCQRGTLMRWGTEACDGELRLDLCSCCTLQKLGMPRFLAEGVGRVPRVIGEAIGLAGLSGPAWTALRLRSLTATRHQATRDYLAGVDQIVAVSQWGQELLLRNGVPPGKIFLSQHGLLYERIPPTEGSVPSARSTTLRVAFLGRMDPTKGPHILLEALRRKPSLNLSLDLYGIIQRASDKTYSDRLKQAAAGDRRVAFLPAVRADQVIPLLRKYDLLAVPSQWLETGPMVVLEAFAAGIPVLGSNLGGICEMVRHGVNGMLVDPYLPDAWSRALEELCSDPGKLAVLRGGIVPPRTMEEVAEEMTGLYERLLRTGG